MLIQVRDETFKLQMRQILYWNFSKLKWHYASNNKNKIKQYGKSTRVIINFTRDPTMEVFRLEDSADSFQVYYSHTYQNK